MPTLKRKQKHPAAWWLASLWTVAVIVLYALPASPPALIGTLIGYLIGWFILYYVFAGVGTAISRARSKIAS